MRRRLVRGFIGTLIAIAASISTTATGFLFEALDNWQGFLILSAASAVATASLWATMPETRPLNISTNCCISAGRRVADVRSDARERKCFRCVLIRWLRSHQGVSHDQRPLVQERGDLLPLGWNLHG